MLILISINLTQVLSSTLLFFIIKLTCLLILFCLVVPLHLLISLWLILKNIILSMIAHAGCLISYFLLVNMVVISIFTLLLVFIPILALIIDLKTIYIWIIDSTLWPGIILSNMCRSIFVAVFVICEIYHIY